MNIEQLVMICTSDMSGQVRGKAFPAKDMEKRLKRGIGWVPTNTQITTFDTIAESPFGALGDLLMVPDPDTEVKIDYGDGKGSEHFFIGNINYTNGQPWECCLRNHLLSALDALKSEAGLILQSAFEVEFQFVDESVDFGAGFSLSGLREKKEFGETYMAALRQAGVEPDSFLREWGAGQYEVTMHPQKGVTAADHALLLKEVAKSVAWHMGESITFTPLRGSDHAGNGVHIHMSFLDEKNNPATYDPNGPGGLSVKAAQFVAGILHHLPSITAMLAPSLISYQRLTPHRWSAAYTNLGFRDREASVRICPVAEYPGMDIAKQFNFEVRACDSAASSYLQLAALVFAGLDGIKHKMKVQEPTEEDLSVLEEQHLNERGIYRLPESLSKALELFERSESVRSWFGDLFVDVYVLHKRGEIEALEEKSSEEIYEVYEKAYS